MKVVQMYFRILAGICTVGILCVALLLAPCLAKQRPVVLLTGSMTPVYPVGSLLYVKNLEFSEVEIGDDITFSPDMGETIVTHRVVEKQEDGYVTRGVANETNDTGIVTRDKYLGTVTLGIPKAGYVIQGIQKPQVIIPIAAILLIKILLSMLAPEEEPEEELQKIPKKRRKKQGEQKKRCKRQRGNLKNRYGKQRGNLKNSCERQRRQPKSRCKRQRGNLKNRCEKQHREPKAAAKSSTGNPETITK